MVAVKAVHCGLCKDCELEAAFGRIKVDLSGVLVRCVSWIITSCARILATGYSEAGLVTGTSKPAIRGNLI